VESCIEAGDRKIIAFYHADNMVRLRYWDLEPSENWCRYFHNINTEAERRALDDLFEE
jgi:molybdopterin-guanine dinucleotide biosynthesis protein A